MPSARSLVHCRTGDSPGGCGDSIRYVCGNKQYRRLYVRPTNPRTSKQQHRRDRSGAASKQYSLLLTDEQQDACIAEGAKQQSRPHPGEAGPLIGQPYSKRSECVTNPDVRRQKKAWKFFAVFVGNAQALWHTTEDENPLGRRPVIFRPYIFHPISSMVHIGTYRAIFGVMRGAASLATRLHLRSLTGASP